MSRKEKVPPKMAQRLLTWLIRDDIAEEVLGDLEEKFYSVAERQSLTRAKINYWYQVINYLRPFAIRKTSPLNNVAMVGNFFKVGYRNLIRHKTLSTINISGLALGIACFIGVFLWVKDEMSVDNFHHKGPNLYNFYQSIHNHGEIFGTYSTPMRYDANGLYFPLDDLPEVMPEVKSMTYYATGYELPWGYPKTFRVMNRIHKLEGSRASPGFFKIFDFPIIAGDRETPLIDVSSIAISRKMSQLFFDSPEQAIGKQIRYENKFDFMITAVFEDVPDESSLQFDYIINWESQLKRLEWSSEIVLTTIELEENSDPEIVGEKINDLLQSRLDENESFENQVGIIPFNKRYLYSHFTDEKPTGGRIEYVRIFSVVGIFILLVACINFMNLSTARSVKRAKEVALRKVVGSGRGYLIGQFLCESVLIAFIALLVSVVLVAAFIPVFNSSLNKSIEIPFTDASFWGIVLGVTLFTGLLAGSYPALFLSSLQPIKSLKGTLRISGGAVWFRKGLVIFQFGIAILLLIATIVTSRQTEYVRTKNLGYDRENLLSFRVEGEINEKYDILKNKLANMPGVAGVDRSSEAPHAMGALTAGNINWQGKDHEVIFKPSSVGFDFLKLMGLEVVEGRGFSKDHPGDTSAFMINEMALKQMRLKNPIGKWISAWDKKGHIIGILKDYHTSSLHEPIRPVILDIKEDLYFGFVLVKTKPGQLQEAIASLEKVHREINPDFPLNFQFMDVEYNKMYQNEVVMAKLSNISSALAIVISCLGLLGLAIFSAEQRRKEIGIRKVLGASMRHIVLLFSKDFLRLVTISFVVITPVAWYLMNRWLQGFAYRIELAWWIFVAGGILSLCIALLTVSYHSVRTALANPVNSLRSE